MDVKLLIIYHFDVLLMNFQTLYSINFESIIEESVALLFNYPTR